MPGKSTVAISDHSFSRDFLTHDPRTAFDADRGFLRTRLFAVTLLSVLALLGAVLGWASWKAGSLRGAFQYVAGADIIINPTIVTVSGQLDGRREVVMRNMTGASIRIVGYNASCSCVKIENLPVEIRPALEARITLHADSRIAKVVPVILLADRAMDVPLRFDVKIDPNSRVSQLK